MDDVEPSRALAAALIEVRDITGDTWTEGHISELALRLDRVNSLRQKLDEIKGWLEIDLADRMEGEYLPIPGIGRLHKTEGTSSGWKTESASEMLREDLANAIARDLALNVATGELDQLVANVARATMKAAYEAIPAFSSLKAAGPKRFGVKISDYRNYSTTYKVALEVGVTE